MSACACLWCPVLLPDERGRGSPRRFCSTACRQAFHAAARQYALAAGRLTVARLRECAQESVHACSDGQVGAEATHLAAKRLQ